MYIHIDAKFDVSKLEYETIAYGFANNESGDVFRFVKWESVPQNIKNTMFNHIKGWMDKQTMETNKRPYIYIEGYSLCFQRQRIFTDKKELHVLFSHAILEYLNTHKELVPRPFTLTCNKEGWFINFIYNY
jgi:hypothetical protein